MDKDFIVLEIKRTADLNDGKPLGRGRFYKETGIRESDWYGKHWVSWSEAITEAGLKPNQFKQALDENFLMDRLVGLIRKLERFPTQGHLRMESSNDKTFPDHKVFYNRFGSKENFIKAVREYCVNNSLHDVMEYCPLLPAKEENQHKDIETGLVFGWVYLYKSGRDYKIGKTNNISRRDREINLQLPKKAELVHRISTDDPTGIEKYWHERFASKRLNGEWFNLSTSDVKTFKRRKFM